MAMALHAGKCGTHGCLPGCIYPIHHCRRSKLFIVGATFIIGHGVALKSCGNKIIISSGG